MFADLAVNEVFMVDHDSDMQDGSSYLKKLKYFSDQYDKLNDLIYKESKTILNQK